MPAVKQPRGSIPETKVDASTAESSAAAEEVVEASAKETEEPDVDESDLKEVEDQGKIPYSRFKEVNEKAKRLERQMVDLNRKYEEDVRRAIFEKEAALLAAKSRKEEASVLDLDQPAASETTALKSELQELKKELASFKGMTRRQQVSSEIKELAQKYPEADELAVLGWKQNQPDADLEELMELSHRKTVEKIEKKLQGIIEKKKAKKTQASTASASSGFNFKVDEKEKPKTVEEAGRMLKRFFAKG